jgi:hypothetical protein
MKNFWANEMVCFFSPCLIFLVATNGQADVRRAKEDDIAEAEYWAYSCKEEDPEV